MSTQIIGRPFDSIADAAAKSYGITRKQLHRLGGVARLEALPETSRAVLLNDARRGAYRRKSDPTVQIQWLVNMDTDAWIREQARQQNVTPGQVLDKMIAEARA